MLVVRAVGNARIESRGERRLGDLGHVVKELVVVPVLQQFRVDRPEGLDEDLACLRIILLEHEIVIVQVPELHALEQIPTVLVQEQLPRPH